MTGTETFIAAIVGQAVTVILAYIGYLKVTRSVTGVKSDVQVVHDAVNSNLTVAQNRNEQLTSALTAAAIPVPKSPEAV